MSGDSQFDGVDMRLLRDDRIGPNRVAVLREDLFYCYPPTRELVVVPQGYLTDFASVPGGAHLMVERYGDNIEAAIVHDWLYAVGEVDRRDWADEVFRHALSERGVGMLNRNAAYIGVKAGGQAAYGRPREWSEHFFDVRTMMVVPPAFGKPRSPVRAILPTCDALENAADLEALRRQYGSKTWP